MLISYFEEFITLSDTGSFGLTAERHYISIATLSRHMHTLEEWLGVILLQRAAGHTILTEAGRKLLPYAHTIVNSCSAYRDEAANIQKRPIHNISISATVPMSFYGITEAIENFQHYHADIRIDVRLNSFSQVSNDLLNGGCDFAILWHMSDTPYGLTAIPLKQISFSLLIDKQHRLAQKPFVRMSELKDEPLILLDDSFAFYDTAIQMCMEAGFTPYIAATAHRGISIEDLVMGGFGIGLLPIDPDINLSKGIIQKPIIPRAAVTLDVVYNSAQISESGRALLAFLCHTFAPDYQPVLL